MAPPSRLTGIVMAGASRYLVVTHWIAGIPTWNWPAWVCGATLVMVPPASRTLLASCGRSPSKTRATDQRAGATGRHDVPFCLVTTGLVVAGWGRMVISRRRRRCLP